MSAFKQRMEERRKATYRAVHDERFDLYTRAVEIGHLGLATFGGNDENNRAATIEAAVMSLIESILGEMK